LPYAEIAAQYAALPPVCVMFYYFSEFEITLKFFKIKF
jgi:hypothetical protein